ncbi:MAG TPA: hypothetical protein VGR28_00350 [Candidatus Thermoplasmatota archaeon]|jgi:hypothetical protein|nr:hypothetical protein [Candidatus Thermoplasmatota archaeon]
MGSLRQALAPAGLLLFSACTALLAVLALQGPTLARAGLWPHAYFLAISAQWGALGLLCAGLCARGAPPLLALHRRFAGRGAALAALLGFHALMALASVLMGFADALVGGQKLPGFLVELLPREGQLLLLLCACWAMMVLGASFLWVSTRIAPIRPPAHAVAIAVALFTGAIAYWGWGWSRFYATHAGQWFSLWKVGALDIAVDGTIFQALLVVMPAVHGALVAWLAVRLARAPLASLAEVREAEPASS